MRRVERVPPLIRSTARFFNTGSIFAVEVDTKDLLAMVAFQLSMHNLELEKRNDTNPFTDKIQELTTELEGYLKK